MISQKLRQRPSEKQLNKLKSDRITSDFAKQKKTTYVNYTQVVFWLIFYRFVQNLVQLMFHDQTCRC